jgi:hypothetical protein
MKLAVRVVAMMMCCLLSASAQKAVEELTDERALGIAREVVAALGGGDAAAAYERFDEAMRKAVALPQLEGVWKSIPVLEGGL